VNEAAGLELGDKVVSHTLPPEVAVSEGV